MTLDGAADSRSARIRPALREDLGRAGDGLRPAPSSCYGLFMTKDQIDAVLDRIHTWPPPRQEDAVRVLLAMEAQEASTYLLSDDERADLEAAFSEVALDR
jgi:hypothetical protein